MDEKLKNKWVKALRSGKYIQAREALRDSAVCDDRYDEETEELEYLDVNGNVVDENAVGNCCLGVLCEIAPGIQLDDNSERYIITSQKLKKLFPKDGDGEDSWEFDKDGNIYITGEDIPEPLAKHYGLHKRVVDHGARKTLQSKLIGMNDGGKNFEQIAKYVEKVL